MFLGDSYIYILTDGEGVSQTVEKWGFLIITIPIIISFRILLNGRE